MDYPTDQQGEHTSRRQANFLNRSFEWVRTAFLPSQWSPPDAIHATIQPTIDAIGNVALAQLAIIGGSIPGIAAASVVLLGSAVPSNRQRHVLAFGARAQDTAAHTAYGVTLGYAAAGANVPLAAADVTQAGGGVAVPRKVVIPPGSQLFLAHGGIVLNNALFWAFAFVDLEPGDYLRD